MVFNVLGKKKNVDLMFVQIMIHHSQNIVIVKLKISHAQHLVLVVLKWVYVHLIKINKHVKQLSQLK